MIYANLDYFNGKLNSSKLDRYDKWLAQWSSKPTYNKNFGIWQYSSKGTVPGITGNVDLNVSYKDYPSIINKNSKFKYSLFFTNKVQQKYHFGATSSTSIVFYMKKLAKEL